MAATNTTTQAVEPPPAAATGRRGGGEGGAQEIRGAGDGGEAPVLSLRRPLLCLEPVADRLGASQTRDLPQFQLRSQTHFLRIAVVDARPDLAVLFHPNSPQPPQTLFLLLCPRRRRKCWWKWCFFVFLPGSSAGDCRSVSVLGGARLPAGGVGGHRRHCRRSHRRRGKRGLLIRSAPFAAFDVIRWERGLKRSGHVRRQREEAKEPKSITRANSEQDPDRFSPRFPRRLGLRILRVRSRSRASSTPKFRAFLSQVGLPPVSRRELAGGRLDAKYEEAKAETEAKIRDAMFFQVSSDGWKSKNSMEENLVNLGVNLPNGTSVFRRAVFTSGSVPSKYAEEVLWDTIRDICGNVVQQCVGIVSDKFKAKALRSLESQHHWMVNLACQLQGITSLIKDFSKELPLFKNVTDKCLKLVNFVNNKSQIRNAFHKYQLQEYGQAGLLRVPLNNHENSSFGPMVEDVLSSARAFQLVLLDESFKIVSMEEQIAREIEDMMRDPKFWNELEAVHSLVKLIKGMAQEVERDRPLVGQCIPLWDEIRVKVKEWCSRFHIAENPVDKVIDKRFQKNYHPAWAAAFILDPLYLIRDTSGKYLPPFKCLTPEQEKDVDKLITRLVSREEAHIALMELMKWRTEGLDPVYAQAVQLKQRDPVTGKMKIANPQSSRLVWETHLTQFKSLGKVAVRLIFLHATSCGFKCNWSFLRWVSAHGHSRVGLDRAQKLVFIAAHSKLERRDFSTDEEKDAELFALANGEDDELHDVFSTDDASSA
ncbi:hypothetical protein Acr_18g0011230 [Actinidia rufa]|uniref:Uncharacterized protein n=1 Tax=Actinidia rufa TaxID=165716 RepID=A0A7J0G842_9ERIC|nr:hypothetical protein Acr_18g0011230 [Actinidia rufa]